MTRLERGILQGAFTLCLMLPACQKAFDYDAASPSSRLAPAEVYQVEVDTSVDPLTEAASKMRDRQFVHAVAYYKAALAQDPGSESAILGLASAYSLLGQFKQADVYFARYKKANGNNATYLNDYGFSMMLRGNLTQAEKLLQRASSEQPGSLTIQNNLAALRRLKANPTGFVGHRPKRGTSSF